MSFTVSFTFAASVPSLDLSYYFKDDSSLFRLPDITSLIHLCKSAWAFSWLFFSISTGSSLKPPLFDLFLSILRPTKFILLLMVFFALKFPYVWYLRPWLLNVVLMAQVIFLIRISLTWAHSVHPDLVVSFFHNQQNIIQYPCLSGLLLM